MFFWSFCDGFFGFPAIGSSRCDSIVAGSSRLVLAGVLELIEQLFQQLPIEIMASLHCSGWCPVVIKRMVTMLH
jgi:hypothetical protein